NFPGVQGAAGAVVHPAGGLGRRGPACREFVRRAVTVVRCAGRNETTSRLAIVIEPGTLKVRRVRAAGVRPLVPIEPKPPQALKNPGHHVGRRAFDVRVLDAQDERTSEMSRVQPVEERGSSSSDVKIAGWRGRE